MLYYLTLGLLLVTSARVGAFSIEDALMDLNYISECKQDPFELSIVLDSSSSIRPSDFTLARKFLQDFVGQYHIGPDQVRVSLITFGKGIYVKDSFDLDTYLTKDALIEAIGKIPFKAGPYTATGEGIRHAHKVQLAPSAVRPGMERVCIVITDGNSQEWRKTKEEAASARADNITMFAIGVGKSVKDSEMLNIAGDVSRTTRVDNFDKLSGIKEELKKQTCIRVLKPTTPPPKTQSCGEANPADVQFIYSGDSLGAEGVQYTTYMINQMISSDDIKEGYRYGVVSGSCPDDEGFKLDRYDNVADIKNRLQQIETSQLGKHVRTARTLGFSEKWGGRPDARKIAVVVASYEDIEGKTELIPEIGRMIESGIEVFIADPFDTGVEVKGATTISEYSAKDAATKLLDHLCP